VDGDQKTLVGELGAVDKMLQLIRNRLSRNICDEVMETAWSTMWNVTGWFRLVESRQMIYFNMLMIEHNLFSFKCRRKSNKLSKVFE